MRNSRAAGLATALAVATLLAAAPAARAQRLPVGDPWEDYARVMGLLGRAAPNGWTVRPLADTQALAGLADTAHPWRDHLPRNAELLSKFGLRVEALPVTLRSFNNSAYPSGQNDGAVFQGRGLTLALDGGIAARFGPLTVTLRPQVIYSRNRAFELAPVVDSQRTPYANPWWARGASNKYIDQPQRFGPDPYWVLDPGWSSIRLDWRGVATGVSTETLWWGPGIANAIIMSNNAAGFPHAFLATSRPLNVGIGHVEAQWIWGRLTQSQWSQRRPDGLRRFLTGAVGAFQPKWLPGLTVGATRVYYLMEPPGGVSLRDCLLVFQGLLKKGLVGPGSPYGNDETDQLASIFARWAFPESGFEAYVEWARNDHSWDLRDFILEPEHSQAYTLGFQKAFALTGGQVVRLNGELTHLERSITYYMREGTPSYYVHFVMRDGYTQRGQVIGAGIGTGGDAQILGADLFTGWGSVGLYARRQVHDNDAHAALLPDDYWRHDVSAGLGARGSVFLGPGGLLPSLDLGSVQVQWLAEVMLERNRYFVFMNDVRNTHLELSLRWAPGSARRSEPDSGH